MDQSKDEILKLSKNLRNNDLESMDRTM